MATEPRSIRHEAGREGGRYVYPFADGDNAELIYFERPTGVVTIVHTETPARHRGEGVASALVTRAVGDFRAAGKTVIPACPFARLLFQAHPEWRDLLPGDGASDRER